MGRKQDITKQYEGLRERFGNGDIDRRTFLSSIGLMAMAAGAVTTSSSVLSRAAQAATDQIRFDSFGGFSGQAFRKFAFDPFTAKTGIKVAEGSYGSPDEVVAKVRAEGLGIYNFFWSSNLTTIWGVRKLGIGVEIDETKVPQISNLVAKFVSLHRDTVGGGKMTSIPWSLSGATMAYNTRKIDKAEVEAKGFKILLDPKYKEGIVGDRNYTSRVWMAALQTDQDPNNIKDLKAVWDVMRQAKGNALKYWSTSAEQIKLWTEGDAFLGDAWYVPFYNMRKNGLPLAHYRDPQSLYVTPGGIVALKGSPMDAFYELASILFSPEVMMNWSVASGNLPLLDPTKIAFPPEVQAIPGYDKTGTMDGFLWYDPQYWGDNADMFAKETQRIMAGA